MTDKEIIQAIESYYRDEMPDDRMVGEYWLHGYREEDLKAFFHGMTACWFIQNAKTEGDRIEWIKKNYLKYMKEASKKVPTDCELFFIHEFPDATLYIVK